MTWDTAKKLFGCGFDSLIFSEVMNEIIKENGFDPEELKGEDDK